MPQNAIEVARAILTEIGMPKAQQNDRSALVLLALGDLQPDRSWADVAVRQIGVTPIIAWCAEHHGRQYAPNTRETFRRQSLHQFVDAGLALYNSDKPNRPVNSPAAVYQLSSEAISLIRAYDTQDWASAVQVYLKSKPGLAEKYAAARNMEQVPVRLRDGHVILLSPGAHNVLIRDIVETFAANFVPGAQLIYVGDTGDKAGYFDAELLAQQGVSVDKHGKMPDVVLFDEDRNWLVLVESVTSHGPVDGKRHDELKTLFAKSKAGLVFVSAFPDRSTMAKYLNDLAWETEVWIAVAPTHLMHLNGSRFLGPYD
jgi:BsuBI/PstI restriction endonuclease domain/BsuBI/PstI restriction endonuclease HTH domain